MNKSKFEVGDKVKVLVGGYGVHPDDIGSILTIKSKKYGDYLRHEWAYKVEEETLPTTGALRWVAEPCLQLLEKNELQEDKPLLMMSFVGNTIYLDPSIPFSRQFADVMLDVVYGKKGDVNFHPVSSWSYTETKQNA